MPWMIQQHGNEWCVHKQGESTPVKGGCHSSRADAVNHLRALYANEPTMKKMSALEFTDAMLEPTDDPNVKWVAAWRYGTWDHPRWGKIDITPEVGRQFKEHFDSQTLGREHLINYDHGEDRAKGNKAAGKILAIDPREDYVWYKCEFNDIALQEIANKEWRYISPEYWDFWINPETNDVFDNVPVDLALTNTPFFKGLPSLNFSEYFGKVDEGLTESDKEFFEKHTFAEISGKSRNDLPDSAFLYIEPGGRKDASGKTVPRSLRHLPVHDAAHLRNAISRLSQSGTGEGWLTESLRTSLLAKARAKLGNKPKGGSEVDELLKKFAERLGIHLEDDDSEDTVLAAADEFNKITEPLRNAKQTGERNRTFREAFPDEYAEMERLRESRVEQEALAFSESYSRFTVKDEGGNEFKSIYGFSQLVKDEIKGIHKKFSEKSVTHSDLKKLLDLIGDKGIVDYSEHGSSRREEHREFSEEPRLAFSEAVQDIMEKDNLEYEAALHEAAVRFPKLYEGYVKAIPQR